MAVHHTWDSPAPPPARIEVSLPEARKNNWAGAVGLICMLAALLGLVFYLAGTIGPGF